MQIRTMMVNDCHGLYALWTSCKVALVAFSRKEAGNDFWERMGFTRRDDLCYRNKTLVDMNRIDT